MLKHQPFYKARRVLYKNVRIVQFVLSAVSGTQHKEGRQLFLDVVGVTTGKGARLEKVWTTETLPVMERSISADKDVKDWPHLKNLLTGE